ncbi:MAG: hypothetical protein NZ108_09145 [Bacteroidia bacterium]|nr:hypothetical protein [Bacteroidia bacterium]
MLKYFLFILLGFIAILLVIRLYWVQILNFLLQKISGKILDDFAKQNNAHQEQYAEFEKQIFISKDLEIKIPKQQPKPPQRTVIEDVDFEEID